MQNDTDGAVQHRAATASDLMRRDVVAVSATATLAEAVDLMVAHRISGVPVVDADQRLIGILTEGDLLRRAETGTDGEAPGWWTRLLRPGSVAADYVRTHARHVSDLMTRDVVSVSDDAPLWQVAALMREHGIKRVPVLREGRLMGIVSRADLLAELARALPRAGVTRADGEILAELEAAIRDASWGPNANVSVTVHDGVVTLQGCLFDVRYSEALRVLAETTPGVQRVESNIVCIEPMSGMILAEPARTSEPGAAA